LKNFKFVILICIIIITPIALISCSTGNFYDSWFNSDSYIIGGGSSSAEEIDKITIDWISGKIKIITADVDEITFYEDCEIELVESKKMRYYISNGLLDIKYVAPKENLFSWNFDKTLTIAIPNSIDKTLEDIEIFSTSGGVNIENINSDVIYIESTSGDIEFDNTSAVDTKVYSTSGDIDIYGGEFGDLFIDKTSGDFNIEDCTVEELKIDKTSGNIDIGNITVDNVVIESISGDMEFSAITMPSKIDITSVSGDVELIIPENEGFKLNYLATAGSYTNEFATTSDGDNEYVYANGENTIIIKITGGDLIIKKL
jgi:DUF4097 and DUF4098 domain-containing protein YvlB